MRKWSQKLIRAAAVLMAWVWCNERQSLLLKERFLRRFTRVHGMHGLSTDRLLIRQLPTPKYARRQLHSPSRHAARLVTASAPQLNGRNRLTPLCSCKSPAPRDTTEPDDSNSRIRYLSTDILRTAGRLRQPIPLKGDGRERNCGADREYDRFGLNRCPCESLRWRLAQRFIYAGRSHYDSTASARPRRGLSDAPLSCDRRSAGATWSSTELSKDTPAPT